MNAVIERVIKNVTVPYQVGGVRNKNAVNRHAGWSHE
jgi:hypothetical protein